MVGFLSACRCLADAQCVLCVCLDAPPGRVEKAGSDMISHIPGRLRLPGRLEATRYKDRRTPRSLCRHDVTIGLVPNDDDSASCEPADVAPWSVPKRPRTRQAARAVQACAFASRCGLPSFHRASVLRPWLHGHPLAFGPLPGVTGYRAYLAPAISRRGEEGFSSCLACPCHRAVASTPPKWISRVVQISAAHAAFALQLRARPSGPFTFGATSAFTFVTARRLAPSLRKVCR
jgi:hypothetical protein